MNRDTSATIEGAVATAGGANERELLARVAEGDSAAGRELVRRYDRLIAARRNVRSRPVEDIEARVAPERDASDEVEWALERREQCVALREAMTSITSEERHLIHLLTVEERPCYATISAATSRPVGSLGPTRRRILGKLRAHPAMARVAVAA